MQEISIHKKERKFTDMLPNLCFFNLNVGATSFQWKIINMAGELIKTLKFSACGPTANVKIYSGKR